MVRGCQMLPSPQFLIPMAQCEFRDKNDAVITVVVEKKPGPENEWLEV
jgi:hypothetical protein